jgi:hypothetical protein
MTPTTADTGNIAITAAEGGIGYWSVITNGYEPSRWLASPDGEPSNDLPDDFVFYTIAEDAEAAGGEPAETWDITPALIKRGFALAMSPGSDVAPWAFRDQIDLNDPDSISYMDADAADVVIQMGCHGRIIYG